MEIKSTLFQQYAGQSSYSPNTPTAQADDRVKINQQRSNTQIDETEGSARAGTNRSEQKEFTDGKTVQQAEQSLDEAELKKVTELKQRNTEVRAHESAHLAAAGQYATGGASFDYKRGPDGRSYAVSGEVGIDTSPVPNNPKATLRKAQQISVAANAPANPSAQDRQVAAQASTMAAEARVQVAQEQQDNPLSSATTTQSSDASSEKNSESETVEKSNRFNEKASNEYQSIEAYTDNVTKPLLEIS